VDKIEATFYNDLHFRL